MTTSSRRDPPHEISGHVMGLPPPLCTCRRAPCRWFLAGRPYRPAVLHRRPVGSAAASSGGGALLGYFLRAAYRPGVACSIRPSSHGALAFRPRPRWVCDQCAEPLVGPGSDAAGCRASRSPVVLRTRAPLRTKAPGAKWPESNLNAPGYTGTARLVSGLPGAGQRAEGCAGAGGRV